MSDNFILDVNTDLEEDPVSEESSAEQVDETVASDGDVTEPAKEETAPVEDLSKVVQELRDQLKNQSGRNDELQRQMEFMRAMSVQPKSPEKQAPAYQADEYVPYGETEKLVDQKLGAIRENLRAQEVAMFEKQAEKDYPDFKDVVDKYTRDLIQKGKASYEGIMAAQNPAEFAYLIGTTHPDYRKSQEEKIRAEVAKTVAGKINENLNTQKTITKVGSAPKSAATEVERIAKMSMSDFAKEFPDLV